MKKSILLLLSLLVAAGFVAWKLYDNKRQLAAETELSKITHNFVPVEVSLPRRESIAAKLTADGIFMPAKEMFVISETQGRVLEVYKNKGDAVREGDLIAKIDDMLLRTELSATEANLTKLRADRARLERLIAGEAAPRSKLEEVDLAIVAAEAKAKVVQKQIANTSIRATMTGTMGLRFIERGSVIGPGIQVAQITSLEKLFLMVKVTEKDVAGIRKGQSVAVNADVLTDTTLTGRVTNIGLRADNAFNYDIEIEVPNPKGAPLRAGMHAKAAFAATSERQGLTIPRRAVSGSLQEGKVFVVVQDSLAALRQVSFGTIVGDRVEVTGGLTEQDRVVVTGQLNLSEGTRVEVIRTVADTPGEGK